MDILSLRLFIRIVELEVIAAAAKDLQLSAASASARLAKLEKDVGFRLFHRTTRAVSLTADGAAFLPYAQQMLETLDTGLNTVRGQGAQTRGLLRMTMPGSFGRMYVVPLLSEFHRQYPLVRLDLRLSDEVLDVIEGAFDLVIRNAPLQDSSFVAKKLAADRRLLVASPSYLAQHGTPSHIDDLPKHQCVVLGEVNKWKFATDEAVEAPRSFVVNDGEAMRLMLEQGLGIGLKSLWNVYESLQKGLLVEVLPDAALLNESSIWMLYPSTRIVSPKVRAMIDFLLAHFSPPPWEDTVRKTQEMKAPTLARRQQDDKQALHTPEKRKPPQSQ